MITASKLKSKRMAAGISGSLICQQTRMSRSRLSDIERGYVIPDSEELARIENVISEIVQNREKLVRLATKAGVPLY